jgi:hypothetical protein
MSQIPDPLSPPRPQARRRWQAPVILLVKLLLCIAVIIYVGQTLMGDLRHMQWDRLHIGWEFLGAACALRMLQMFLASLALGRLLEPMCPAPSWMVTFGIVSLSAIGKYIPGRVTGFLGGLWMFQRRQVSVPAATSMMFLGRGLTLSLCLLAAVPLLLWPPVSHRLPLAWLWCIVFVGAIVTCLHPAVFFRLANAILHRMGQRPVGDAWRLSDYVVPLFLLAINLLLGGLALWLIGLSTTDLPSRQIPLLIATSGLAGTAALLAIFTPAGLGVTEGLLLIILGQIVPAGQAAILVILSRLVGTTSDILLAFCGGVILRFSPVQTSF